MATKDDDHERRVVPHTNSIFHILNYIFDRYVSWNYFMIIHGNISYVINIINQFDVNENTRGEWVNILFVYCVTTVT